ncbi:hypothetical protein ACQWFR_24475, partial [Salmonella enterica subsp. enterica serovar Infantis]
ATATWLTERRRQPGVIFPADDLTHPLTA